MEEIIQTTSADYKPYDTEIAAHLVKLVNGTATAESTIRLTEFIRLLFENNWQPKNELDKQFQLHCLYVANQILQHLRKEGLSRESLEACGKLLIRLYAVYKVYRDKNVKIPQLLGRLDELVREAEKLIN